MLPFFVILVILLFAAEAFTLKAPLKGIRYSLRTLSRSVNEGEAFCIESRIENHSRLPKVFLGVTENMPAEMEVLSVPDDCRLSVPEREMNLPRKISGTLFILPGKCVTRQYTVRLKKRGRCFLRGADITGGDFLGFHEETEHFPVFQEIVVLPSASGRSFRMEALGGFLGDRSVRRFTMEDPVLTIGFRDYTGREPQKQISWPQSLRAGKLMVKEYDHTLDMCVTVLLNVEATGDGRIERIEESFRMARTVCEELEARHIQYSFMTNAMAAGALGLWKNVTEGLGAGHLMAILEGLGRATYDPAEAFTATLFRAGRMAEQGRSHVLITPGMTVELMAGIRSLEARTGSAVLTVSLDREEPKENGEDVG